MNIMTDEEISAIDPDALAEGFAQPCEVMLEPVVFAFKHSCGELYGFSDTEHSHGMIGLYTETQLLAAQQKAAEACAEYAVRGLHDDDPFIIAAGIRDEAWREYL